MVLRLVPVRNNTPDFWFGLDYPEHVIHTGQGLVSYDVFLNTRTIHIHIHTA